MKTPRVRRAKMHGVSGVGHDSTYTTNTRIHSMYGIDPVERALSQRRWETFTRREYMEMFRRDSPCH